MDANAHIVVKGMVQGVGFRYFVHNKAAALGLSGWVRNLYDGDVEISVEGDRSLVEEFIAQVKVGPRSAQVNDLVVQWNKPSGELTDFNIM